MIFRSGFLLPIQTLFHFNQYIQTSWRKCIFETVFSKFQKFTLNSQLGENTGWLNELLYE